MTYLALALDERLRPEHLEAIEQRSRAAFIAGAEEQSQTAEGRALTADELERVTRRYIRRAADL